MSLKGYSRIVLCARWTENDYGNSFEILEIYFTGHQRKKKHITIARRIKLPSRYIIVYINPGWKKKKIHGYY